MMRRLYDWMMRMAGPRQGAARAVLGVVRRKLGLPDPARRDADADDPGATAPRPGSTPPSARSARCIGGIAGYAIGYFLFEYIGEPILKLYGYGAEVPGRPPTCFNEWGLWILIAKGWTPFPYKVLTIAAGAFNMSLGPFILASIVARAMRFYLVAALLYWFGEPIRDFIERRLSLVTTAFVVLLVGGFVAVKYLF